MHARAIKQNLAITSVIILIVLVAATQLLGQRPNTTNAGSVKGQIKDSTYGYMLTNATVAIYRQADSTLIQFTILDNHGEFKFKNLPASHMLYLVATHIGFTPLLKGFYINDTLSILDLGTLFMHQNNNNTPSEVIVRSTPPMRINGDTIEFNANAFKTQPDATAEDLLKQLPGFTIWSDGTITYNGKELKTLLVDGKPFLGGNIVTIVTQNIPKDAIDKIQVYQRKSNSNKGDSLMVANIRLKEDKNHGYFGKTSVSGGSNKRFSTDNAISIFNKKIQSSLALSSNNINKIASSMDALLAFSSFKGDERTSDYQTDFFKPGIARSGMIGGRMQYDLTTDNKNYDKNSRINGDFLRTSQNIFQTNHRVEKTAIADDSSLNTISDYQIQKEDAKNYFETRYQGNTAYNEYQTKIIFRNENIKNYSFGQYNQNYSDNNHLSENKISDSTINNLNEVTFHASYRRRDKDKLNQSNMALLRVDADYHTTITFLNQERKLKTDFSTVYSPDRNSHFNRQYNTQNTGVNQTFSIKIPGLSDYLGFSNKLSQIKIGIENLTNISTNNSTDNISDYTTTEQKYKTNYYLSGERKLNIADERLGARIYKTSIHTLSNRFLRQWTNDLKLNGQLYLFTHHSPQPFQNISYRQLKFIPAFTSTYQKNVYASHAYLLRLSYERQFRFPAINELAPLTDSSYGLYFEYGNNQLHEQKNDILSFSYSYSSLKRKRPLFLETNIQYNKKQNVIVDSLIFNTSGQSYIYKTNAGEGSDLTASLLLRQSLEQKKTKIRIEGQYQFQQLQLPSYVNMQYNRSRTQINRFSLSANISFLEILAVQLEQSYETNHSIQNGFNKLEFTNRNTQTGIKTYLKLTPTITWYNYIVFKNNQFGNNANITNSIFNSTMSWRFLKGKTGEIKFSAMDLLDQNNSMTNYAYGNTQTLSNSNVLQRYFMLTLSYYPRKFGNTSNLPKN